MAIIRPYIPSTITVHLGRPDEPAENITIPFIDYVKNVASSEIFPTWPENALRANIYAITTYALNRIYTEWYRSKGYDFDITSSTQFDQAFVKDRDIFENISNLVDEMFDDYVVKQGSVEPYFTQFCDGVNVICEGLSQWGTVTLAEQGLTPYEILQHYYGDDINIIFNAPIQDITETYPRRPLQVGDVGNQVKIIQEQLNRIRKNYPAIPLISPVNGVYGISTEEAVRKFQEIFDLPQTGEVDKGTWYTIKRYYTGVKKLTDLLSEGISFAEAELPFPTELSQGMQNQCVLELQYFLNVIGYFNPNLNLFPIDGIYGQSTVNAVEDFQRFYGLPVNGTSVDEDTWNKIREVYRHTLESLSETYHENKAKLYPGYYLSEGMRGDDVRDLQTYLATIARYYKDLPELPITGYFGPQTRDVVSTFQRLFGLPVTGVVGPITWWTIAQQYDYLVETENL